MMGHAMCVKGHHMGGVMCSWVITSVVTCSWVTHLIMGPPILGRVSICSKLFVGQGSVAGRGGSRL